MLPLCLFILRFLTVSKQVEAEVKVERERSDLITLSLNLNLDLNLTLGRFLRPLSLVPEPGGAEHRDWFP